MSPPLILVTNDDGVYAPGIRALFEAMHSLGEAIIVAPERDNSAVSHALTMHRPLRVMELEKDIHTLDGTPTDCVTLAVNKILPRKPDLIVSGINPGGNLGDDISYSGTVSAATEAAMMGVTSMAVSLDTHQEADFTFAARFASRMVRLIEKNASLHGSAFNVNIPCLPEEKIKGVAVVRQGKGNVIETFEKRTDPRDNIYYWISAESLTASKDVQTDIGALSEGYITITPIQYDLTRYDLLESLKTMLDHPF